MTVVKETPSRPSSQHRHSVGAAMSGMPSRQSRAHSHSHSVGSINNAHRATRRKSISSNNSHPMTAALKGTSGAPQEMSRKSSKSNLVQRGLAAGSVPPMPSSLPSDGPEYVAANFGGGVAKHGGSAVTDGPLLASMAEGEKGSTKARIRRASEGSRLSKGEGKRTSGVELKCEKCGKGYKHSSCLTKHLWEHTPEWAYTSKLLISKHQQVQLLEAASVLVAMNQEPTESTKDSDHSSASPAASGSSDLRDDDLSSTDTTPPPHADYRYAHSKRYSATSSAYSQSYQSGGSIFSESAPNGYGFLSHSRQWSSDGRPTTSGTSVAGSIYDDEEQADLAAAVGLLSCSYGTPKSGPNRLPPDVPPVPPLPARFQDKRSEQLSGSANTLTAATQPSLPGHGHPHLAHEARDVDMGEDDDDTFADDDDYDSKLRARIHIDEDEDGMFGRMEA